MEHTTTHAQTGSTLLAVDVQDVQEVSSRDDGQSAKSQLELMAPGHLYNARTSTGIEWLPPDSESGAPGRVRLWSRGWNGQPTVLAEAEHDNSSPWEYWYNLDFAHSFPQVTHWWFGDAWTGIVRIWGPNGVGRDPESGSPMLSGWMRFGGAARSNADIDDIDDIDATPALPWTVLLTNPVLVSTPMPPRSTNPANLPLQLLLVERVMDVLNDFIDQRAHQGGEGDGVGSLRGTDAMITSLVRRQDLQRAIPTEFRPWRLDRLPGLTPREALCRLQGIEARSVG